MIDLAAWWCERLELPGGRAQNRTFEVEQPWAVYTFGYTHDKGWPLWRSTRVLGRACVGMECAICGEFKLAVMRLPRFGPVPEWPSGRHPIREAFLAEHTHEEDKGHPMSWAKPLLNPDAHPGGMSLDLLAMRLEADLNEDIKRRNQ